MPSVNQSLIDAFTSHAVDLARVEASVQADILTLLSRLESSLIQQLATSDPTGPVRTAFQRQRLQALLTSTQETIRKHYATINQQFRDYALEIASVEHVFTVGALNQALGLDLITPTLDTATLRTLVSEVLIQGAPSAEWWQRQAPALQTRFLDAMRQGMVQGETLAQLIRRVRGTRQNNFTDGLLRASRTSAERLVRSSIQTAATAVRNELFTEHADLIKSKMWGATLDLRTSPICQVRDRKLYTLDNQPIGHPYPILGGPGAAHWQCRSSWIPQVRSWSELSRRRAVKTHGHRTSIRKAYERRMQQRGFTDAEIAERLFRARASMDGLVPQATAFPTWLRQKDAASPGFGAQVLGPVRWKLWRSGQLSFSDLVNFKGEPLTLDALREKLSPGLP